MIKRAGRLLHGFWVWACLASFGAFLGMLALLRNLERAGPGGRWRRSDASPGEIDALTRTPEKSGSNRRVPAGGDQAGV